MARCTRRPAVVGGCETLNGVPTRVEVRSEAFSDAGSTPAASTIISVSSIKFWLTLPPRRSCRFALAIGWSKRLPRRTSPQERGARREKSNSCGGTSSQSISGTIAIRPRLRAITSMRRRDVGLVPIASALASKRDLEVLDHRVRDLVEAHIAERRSRQRGFTSAGAFNAFHAASESM